MKLKGINITNIGTYKKHFSIEEVWENVENGVFLEFQEKIVSKEENNLAKELANVLQACESRGKSADAVSAFYHNGSWDLEALEKKIEPVSSKSKEHDGSNFYSRNANGIQRIVNGKVIAWNGEKTALFYLFLLCFLQARPEEVISEEAFAFIVDKLGSAPGEAAYEEENEQDSGLYPHGSGVLFLKDKKIMNERQKQISPEHEMISCFAYTEDLGLIAFTEQGTFSAGMEPMLRYGIEQKMAEAGRENERIVMVTAYGKIYALLLDNGSILTNVLDSIESWKDIRWVGAGLNSLTAVRGNRRHLLELGSDKGLSDFSDVKAAYTWSADGCYRYAVLKENGDMVMDDKTLENGVSAANIGQEGYFYAIGEEIFWKEFDSGKKKKYILPSECTITGLCKCRSNMYCRAKASTEEKLFAIEISSFAEV